MDSASFKKSFQEAKRHFINCWEPERRRVLQDLEAIKNEIQEQERIFSIGSITYSSVGIVGGVLTVAGVAAPFTFGVSLAFVVAGAATGVVSGLASTTHGFVKIGIIMKQCSNAKESLRKHQSTCIEMGKLVKILKSEIKLLRNRYRFKSSHKREFGAQMKRVANLPKPIAELVLRSKAAHVYRTSGKVDEAAKVLNLGKVLDDMVPSFLKDVSINGGTKLSTKAVSALAVVGILVDLFSLILDAKDVHSIEKGELCSNAKKLQDVIDQMKDEYDYWKEKIIELEAFADL